MDVVFFESFYEEVLEIKKYLPPDIRTEFIPSTIQESRFTEPPAALISIRTQSVIPAAWATGAFLKGVLSRSSGYDHLIKFRRETEISMGYLPDYCARSVAEHAVLVAMLLLRRIRRQINHFAEFNRDHITGREFSGKNMLVVGVGRIGSQVVEMAAGLKMSVKGVDLVRGLENLEYVPLDDGMKWADVVICALPLTDLTAAMFNRQTFDNAKDGVVFVNVSRGEISPLKDLYELIKNKKLSGLGLDVFESEAEVVHQLRRGPAEGKETGAIIRELAGRDNVIFTPHNAFNTEEALARKAKQSAEAVAVFLKSKTFPSVVPQA